MNRISLVGHKVPLWKNCGGFWWSLAVENSTCFGRLNLCKAEAWEAVDIFDELVQSAWHSQISRYIKGKAVSSTGWRGYSPYFLGITRVIRKQQCLEKKCGRSQAQSYHAEYSGWGWRFLLWFDVSSRFLYQVGIGRPVLLPCQMSGLKSNMKYLWILDGQEIMTFQNK